MRLPSISINLGPVISFSSGLGLQRSAALNPCPSARPGVASARATDARGITRSAQAPSRGRTGIRVRRCATAHAPLRARGAAPLRLQTKTGVFFGGSKRKSEQGRGLPSGGAIVPLDGEALARLAYPFARGGQSPLVKAAETRCAVRLLPRAFRVRLCAVPHQRGRSSAVRASGGSQSCAKWRARNSLAEADDRHAHFGRKVGEKRDCD